MSEVLKGQPDQDKPKNSLVVGPIYPLSISHSSWIHSPEPIEGDHTYTKLDRHVGLALFDREYWRQSLRRVLDNLSVA